MLPLSVAETVALLNNFEQRHLWDPVFRDARVVERIDAETDVVCLNLRPLASNIASVALASWPLSAFTAARELVYLRYQRAIDISSASVTARTSLPSGVTTSTNYAILEIGVASAKAMSRNGVVRSPLATSGYFIQALPIINNQAQCMSTNLFVLFISHLGVL